MSAPFVTQLRARSGELVLAGANGAGKITIRVQASDIWATVRVIASPESTVEELRQRVVAELFPADQYSADFVLKLRGWELLDANASLAESGVVDGSIVLLAYRRRRPVR